MILFKKKSLGLVITLYLVTGGVYGIYWIIRNGFAASALAEERRTRFLSGMLLVALVVFIFTIVLAMRSVATHEVSQPELVNFQGTLTVAALTGTLIYLLAAVISARIAKMVRNTVSAESHPACSSLKAILMTFLGFASAIYLQHHINRLMADLKSQNGLPTIW